MFGAFSMSTIALVALYVYGWLMMLKAGMNAGMSWYAAALWAAVWPVSAWKLLKDLWRAPPPPE
jgi:hypothetical protein